MPFTPDQRRLRRRRIDNHTGTYHRRRVRLDLVVDQEIANESVLGFQDDHNELVHHNAHAQGAVCDSAQDAMRALNPH